eukprot:360380-Chlamydomonas_euryale.AAC.3
MERCECRSRRRAGGLQLACAAADKQLVSAEVCQAAHRTSERSQRPTPRAAPRPGALPLRPRPDERLPGQATRMPWRWLLPPCPPSAPTCRAAVLHSVEIQGANRGPVARFDSGGRRPEQPHVRTSGRTRRDRGKRVLQLLNYRLTPQRSVGACCLRLCGRHAALTAPGLRRLPTSVTRAIESRKVLNQEAIERASRHVQARSLTAAQPSKQPGVERLGHATGCSLYRSTAKLACCSALRCKLPPKLRCAASCRRRCATSCRWLSPP